MTQSGGHNVMVFLAAVQLSLSVCISRAFWVCSASRVEDRIGGIYVVSLR